MIIGDWHKEMLLVSFNINLKGKPRLTFVVKRMTYFSEEFWRHFHALFLQTQNRHTLFNESHYFKVIMDSSTRQSLPNHF
jgi:hypothetical protein